MVSLDFFAEKAYFKVRQKIKSRKIALYKIMDCPLPSNLFVFVRDTGDVMYSSIRKYIK